MIATDAEAAEFAVFRQTLGYTQPQMAEKLGLSQSELSRIERGVQRPSRPVVKLLRLMAADPDVQRRVEGHRKRIDAVFAVPVKCRLCGRLAGPGHDEPALVDGLCSKCRQESGRRS